MFFVEVILPLALDKTFTYQVSEAEFHYIKPGMRIAVPFGKTKIYTALALEVHQNKPLHYEAKEIHEIIDEKPIVNHYQLKHWFWITDYYMCSIGEVYKSAIPSALLLESETIILKNRETEVLKSELSDDEFLVYEALEKQNSLKVQDIIAILNKKTVLPVLQKLLAKEVIYLQEEVKENYKPKLIRFVRLHQKYDNENGLKELLETLKNAHKQREVVLKYFQLKASTKKPISVKQLSESAETSASIIKSLVDKEIFEEYFLQTDRTDFLAENLQTEIVLSEAQNKALEDIKQSFETKNTTLLFGVTSSGKTEVYIELIKEYLQKGRQVLYLLPEIALTTQLVSRLRKHFGNEVAVYHSKYNQNERIEVWNQVLNQSDKAKIVIGARSALFLPFHNLGLILVDEEHEQTFKQQDPAPRYHARDTAIVLAELHKAKVLLGSATPSIETFFNTENQKFGLVELTQRFGKTELPKIEIVDLKDKHFRKKMTGHFSDTLLEEITTVLENGEQVILFQNRRGFAPVLECLTCGHIPQCPNCDVSLTYHKLKNQIRCHYCGYAIAKPTHCHACQSVELTTKGFGTEQVQLELEDLFSDKKVIRMDRDTTGGKFGYEKIIDSFKTRESDILVGTQMLAKGLDFDNVGLVGILNADNMLYHPDFRAFERSFQLMTQVSGRAGRSEKQGKVIIQTYSPNHPIIQKVIKNDYVSMYKQELTERQVFEYPPYFRLIKLTLKHRDFEKLRDGSMWLYQSLKNTLGLPVLGPEEPPISRIRNEYIRTILIKIPTNKNLKAVKSVITKNLNSFDAIAQYRSIKVGVNVDFY
ncbi:MAG: primosomal protein N' [Flavobacteriaceae bacterium]